MFQYFRQEVFVRLNFAGYLFRLSEILFETFNKFLMKFLLPSYHFVAKFGTRIMDKLPEIMGSKFNVKIKPASEDLSKNCFDEMNCECIEPSIRKRSGRKRKLKREDCSGLEKIGEDPSTKPKLRPNYFVAVQITNQMIHNAIKNIQSYISSQDTRLHKIMNSTPTLHITLMVMYIGDEETHMRAMKALTYVHRELNSIMCSQPLKLEFSGLGHFRNKVLYAKIQENESYARLCSLSECVKARFAEEDILSTDTRTEFRPHLTIAKIDFSSKAQRAIRKIDPLLYEKLIDQYIGSETIQSIQLLSMTKPKDDTGYYSGDKLYFSLPEAC